MARALLAVALAGAACTSADGADFVVVDTLPAGVVRVTSSAPGGWRDPAKAWRLEEAQRFAGDEGTDAALNEPQSLAVDGGGNVYVADRKPTTIKMFGRDGRFLRTIGREGEGPGEFRSAFIAAWRDRLVVHDPQQSRTSVFDTAGALLTSWRSACCFWDQIGVDTAGRVYIPAPNFAEAGEPGEALGQPWIRYAMDGAVIDTLWVPVRRGEKFWTLRAGKRGNEMVMMMDIPFMPGFRSALHPWGGFVYGWSAEYAFARSLQGKDTTLLVRRAWQAGTIPDSMRAAEVEARMRQSGGPIDVATLRSTFRLDDVPTTAPAYMALEVDGEGNVWARQLLASSDTLTTWDLFDPRGRWLGTVSAPAAVAEWGARRFGRGELYAAVEDEGGHPVVIRWRLVR